MADHPSIERILARAVAQLASVRGVRAIVLGGSRARGWHRADSDIDIGLYYEGPAGLDIAALNDAATGLDDEHRRSLATAPGGWGAWVDGGAWLTMDGIAVDLIYRDLSRVDRIVEEVNRGEFQIAYHAGHPHGFVSSAYAGEAAICDPLYDPDGSIAARKARLAPYPDALRREIVRRFLGEAQFSLLLAHKAAKTDDASYAAGVAFRIVACLCQGLFALNREWLINEKGAVERADSFAVHPVGFAGRVNAAFTTPNGPARAEVLHRLVAETAALASC